MPSLSTFTTNDITSLWYEDPPTRRSTSQTRDQIVAKCIKIHQALNFKHKNWKFLSGKFPLFNIIGVVISLNKINENSLHKQLDSSKTREVEYLDTRKCNNHSKNSNLAGFLGKIVHPSIRPVLRPKRGQRNLDI